MSFNRVPRGQEGASRSSPRSSSTRRHAPHAGAHRPRDRREERRAGELALVGIHRRGAHLAAPPAPPASPSCSSRRSRSATSTSPSTATTSRRAARRRRSSTPRTSTSRSRAARSCIVDDVLFTGRTVRAAIEALFDYGRPRASSSPCWPTAATASCRSAPDYVGKNLPDRRASERVNVRVEELDGDRRGRPSPSVEEALGMRHLLSIEDLDRATAIERILDRARPSPRSPAARSRRSRPCAAARSLNLFYEASHAHALLVRARRQGAPRRRHELHGQRLERRQGRVAQGHRPDAERLRARRRS